MTAKKPRPYPKPKWMSHRQYWWLYKHDEKRLADLCLLGEAPEQDPLDDYRSAMDRD